MNTTFQKGDKVQYRGDERAYVVTKVDGDRVHLRVARLSRFERSRFSSTTADKLQPYSTAAKVAREAARLAKAKTCQICGRPIHAAKGLIAHHGYERPYYGRQTASCYGARHLPFEVSCDVLRMYVEVRLEQRITELAAHLHRLQTEQGIQVPGPAVVMKTADGRDLRDNRGNRIRHNPPIGADHPQYASCRLQAIEATRRELEGWRYEQSEQRKRLEAWKPAGA